MSDIKELRSIELASFTTMSTGIAVMFAIIAAILLTVVLSISVPSGFGLAIYLIPTIIVGAFMYTIYNSFCAGLLYNLLTKKLKTIAVEVTDGKVISKISTTETAMIISIILTIQVILLYLASLFILPLMVTSIIQTLSYSGQTLIAYSLYQILVLINQPTTIAIFLFSTFIISFVFILIGTYVYNILAKRGRGVVLNLSQENGMTAIDSIDSKKLAIMFAIISAILNLIFSIIMMVSGMPITTAIGNVLGGFVGGFIEFYLFAIFYNFLVSKIGKIKIELIDFKLN